MLLPSFRTSEKKVAVRRNLAVSFGAVKRNGVGKFALKDAVLALIRPACAGDKVTLRFRVGAVYKNKKIAVYLGDTCIFARKRPVLAPGEMETIQLKGELLRKDPAADHITVTLEEA